MRAKKGQMIVEYAVMFTVIVAVIIYASAVFIKPALNRFFNTTAKVIDNATNRVENNF
jgi:Flp pilus assembly pilin Flp